MILPSWQFVCHQNQVREAGDFATLDLWRDSIIVMRGKDGDLRAFQNACRHRGAKLLDGEGTCKHRITCPYHAWSYQLDGRLAAVPSEKTFPGIDKAQLGLKELELEVFCGLVFVRIAGKRPLDRRAVGRPGQGAGALSDRGDGAGTPACRSPRNGTATGRSRSTIISTITMCRSAIPACTG